MTLVARRPGDRPPLRSTAEDLDGQPPPAAAAGSGGLRHRRRIRSVTPVAADAIATDTLYPFAQAILVIRWGTTVVSLLLRAPSCATGMAS